MSILNLTQHPATPEQIDAGVIDLSGLDLEALKEALTFKELPNLGEIFDRADWIAALAAKNVSLGDRGDQKGYALYAMIGGALYLMTALESALRSQGIEPLYSFSERKSVEQHNPETGEVKKINVFKHVGFVNNQG